MLRVSSSAPSNIPLKNQNSNYLTKYISFINAKPLYKKA